LRSKEKTAGKEPVLYYNPIVDQQPDTKNLTNSSQAERMVKNAKKQNKIEKNEEKPYISVESSALNEEIEEQNEVPAPPMQMAKDKKKNNAQRKLSNCECAKNPISKNRPLQINRIFFNFFCSLCCSKCS
jgi:phenylalanyl-tRNA synthetase alpha subunit